MMLIKTIGIDAAFANMGLAQCVIHPATLAIGTPDLKLVTTQVQDKKIVRRSSDDLRRATELCAALREFVLPDTAVVFAEVPSGAQSASAARGLGIAVGVLGGCIKPIIEVSPMEVKKLFSDARRKVTKAEIIEWATSKWPEANWLAHKAKGKTVYTQANEHLADAMAVITAGIKTPEFRRMVNLYEATSPPSQRLAFSREPERGIPLGPVSVVEPTDKRTGRKVVNFAW